MYFPRQKLISHIIEIGLIEMDGKMNVSSYRRLFEFSSGGWDIIETDNSALVLSKNNSNQDSFYRIPIR